MEKRNDLILRPKTYNKNMPEQTPNKKGGTHNLVMVVQSFPIVWVTGRPFQMYASLVVLSKVYGSPVVSPSVWVTGPPLQLYGSPVVLSKLGMPW